MLISDIRIRDPFVFPEEGSYYILGTTGEDCWNRGSSLTLYRSEDLISARPVVQYMTDALGGYSQLWAPELHKYRGRYYLLLSVFCKEKGRGSILLSAARKEENFLPLTGDYITPAGWTCLDATLFLFRGKPYLIFSNEWVNTVTQDGDGSLFVASLSEDLTRLTCAPKKIVSGKYCGFSKPIREGKVCGYVAEGPFAFEEGGRIVLTWSTFTEEGYCVCESIAEDIFGEYRFEKFLYRKDGGHAMVFWQDGIKKLVLHRPNCSPLERMHILDFE